MPARQWVLEVYNDLLVKMLPEFPRCVLVGRSRELGRKKSNSIPFLRLVLCKSAQSFARGIQDINSVGKVCLNKLKRGG